jgi:hypothetical protein
MSDSFEAGLGSLPENERKEIQDIPGSRGENANEVLKSILQKVSKEVREFLLEAERKTKEKTSARPKRREGLEKKQSAKPKRSRRRKSITNSVWRKIRN